MERGIATKRNHAYTYISLPQKILLGSNPVGKIFEDKQGFRRKNRSGLRYGMSGGATT